MLKIKSLILLSAIALLSGCEPVNTPDSVMFSTHNTKIEAALQQG